MNILSILQQQNLRALGVEFSPYAVWSLRVDAGPAGVMSSTINWAVFPLKTERVILAQRLLASWWSPSILNGTAVISENYYRQQDILVRMLSLIEEEYPDLNICELQQENWNRIWVLMLYHVWSKECDPATGKRSLVKVKNPLAKQMFERTTTLLKRWFYSYQSGEVSDGPEFLFTAKMVEPSLKSAFRGHAKSLKDWKKGGSYGSIPFVIANVLLADALKICRSNSTKKILVYFNVVRERNAYKHLSSFWEFSNDTQIKRYKNSGNIAELSVNKYGDYIGGDIAAQCKNYLVLPLHHELLKIHMDNEPEVPFIFPWRTYNELRKEYIRIQSAIYIIFLSVMGKRGPSEVRTLRGSDITRSDGVTGHDAVFRPSIWKTNKGVRQEQGVTNFIDEIFELACALGYKNKSGTDTPLFCTLGAIDSSHLSPTAVSMQQISQWLEDYYEDFCNRAGDVTSFNIKKSHNKILSHQFRHSFAEFALRRFDGNVEELIRQHFCHRYNHWWTKRYTEDKLDIDHINEINRQYIKELVPRILFDSAANPEYVGAMALYIKKQFSHTFNIVSADEAESIIEKVCEDTLQVTAHEYGWCLLHRESYGSAKCRDVNGRPNPLATSADKCTSCANFCASRASHLDKQTKILLSHLDFLEQETWKFPSQVKRSRQAVLNAQALFPQLRVYGKV